MMIPVSHLTMPLKSLDFDVWWEKVNPIKGREVPMYRDLFSQQVFGLSKANPLFSVPVETARKSARPARATIILGSLYSALVQYAAAQEAEPGWLANTEDTMLALKQVSVEPPSGAVRALDYIVYFLIASEQGYNNNYSEDEKGEGMETLRLSQMSKEPYKLASEARTNLIHHHVESAEQPKDPSWLTYRTQR